MEQDMLDAMNRLFAQMQKRIAEFGKDTYDESFQSFLDEHGALWEMMTGRSRARKAGGGDQRHGK